MNLWRKAGLTAVLLLTLIWLGCGDVFRPVANPIPKPGGEPAAFHYVLTVNNNAGALSTATQVDVSGDTNLGNFPVGKGPVQATVVAGEIFVANRDDDSISYFSAAAAAGTPANTVLLPPGSKPVFVSPGPSGTVYVANSGNNSVAAISTTLNAVTATVPVGRNPVALAASPDGTKVYCVNKTDGNVTVISTVDNTVSGLPIKVGTAPVWAAMSPDGSSLYVVNQGSGTVSVIDTANNVVAAELPVGAAPNFLFFESHLNRIYVTNPGSNDVTVFDASGPLPVKLATVAVGHAPLSVTALADGTRFYVANSADNTVSVVNAINFTVKPPITVGTTPVWIVSSPDSTKVFTANRDSNSITSIVTSTDSVIATIASGSPQPVFMLTQ